MTISSKTRKAGPFIGNGTATKFSFSFKVFGKTDLAVIVANSLGVGGALTLDSDYSVALNPDQTASPGGTITYPINGMPLDSAHTLTVIGDLAYDQPTDITNNGGFYPQVIEDALDRATIQIQQLAEIASRALQVPPADGSTSVLPSAGARASTVVAFDASGNLTLVPIPASVGAGDMRDEIGSDGQPGLVANIDFVPGTTTVFQLSRAPTSKANVFLEYDGVYQGGDQIQSIVGTTLTLTAPVPFGVSRFYIRTGTTLSLNAPATGSVTDASIAPGSILSSLLSGFISVERFGADRSGLTASDTAFQAAMTFLAKQGGGTLYVPPGSYVFASGLSFTAPNANAAISIIGAGAEVTRLSWANGQGMTFNLLGAFNSVHIRDLTLLTGANGVGSAITLNQTNAAIPNPGNTALSDITNVTIHGSDGQAQVKYWGAGVSVNGVSNVNFTNVFVAGNGAAPYSTLGAGVVLTGSEPLPTVVFNFIGCTFNALNVGIQYGNWVQGVSISQCNFTGDAIGVNAPAGVTGLDQCYIGGSQFNCTTAINVLSALEGLMVASNLFIVPQGGAGINLAYVSLTTITGNTFGPSTYSNTSGNAILIGTSVLVGAVITGNGFFKMPGAAVLLQAASSANNVQSNLYAGNGNNVVNQGSNNTVGGGSA